MSESVLSRVPVDHSNTDGQPRAGNDRKLLAMSDAIAVFGMHVRRRPGLPVSGDLPTGEGQSGGAGGAIRDKNPSRRDPRLVHGLFRSSIGR